MGVTSAAAHSLGLTEEKVNQGTFCDGCGMMPILGNVWQCANCEKFSLCNGCYEKGKHGFENVKDMMEKQKHYAMEELKYKYRAMPQRLIEILMADVCKDSPDKFQYLV